MKRSFSTLLAVSFFILFLAYAGFETIKYFRGPMLRVVSPEDLATLRDPLIEFRGKVARVSYITINGRQIFADTNGDWKAKLLLPPGYSIIRVAVKDRFGKEVWKDLHLTYLPQATTTRPVLEEEPVVDNN